MPINSRFGRPSTIVVPAGESSVGARGVGARDGLAEFQKYIKQANIDRNNREILEKAGVSPTLYEGASGGNLEDLVNQLGRAETTAIGQKKIDVKFGDAQEHLVNFLQGQYAGTPDRLEPNQGQAIAPTAIAPEMDRETAGNQNLMRQLASIQAQPRSIGGDDPTEMVNPDRVKRSMELSKQAGWPARGSKELSDIDIQLDKEFPTGVASTQSVSKIDPAMPSGFEDSRIEMSGVGDLAPDPKIIKGTKPKTGMTAYLAARQLLTDEERGILERSTFEGRLITVASAQDAADAVLANRLGDSTRWAKTIATNPETGKLGILFTDKAGETKPHYAKNPDGSFASPAKMTEFYQNVPAAKTYADIEKTFLSHKDQLMGLQDVRIAFDKTRSSLSASGRFKTFIRRVFDKAGGFKENDFVGKSAAWLDKKFGGDFLAEQEGEFRNTVDLFISAEREFLQWRKFITGVAGGEKEFAEIRKSFLDVSSQGEVEFDQALTNLTSLKEKSYDIYRELIRLSKTNKWTVDQFQGRWIGAMKKAIYKTDKQFFGDTTLGSKKNPKKMVITKKALGTRKKRVEALKQVTEGN